MARIIENEKSERRIIKLSTDDILSIVREYQKTMYGVREIKEVRDKLQDTVMYLPEDI